ncbi:unnamed protein product [Bemisia tabaci]|uniref:Uncharacterized protein n=1 Tax=Bemisia tabaci TaxID=7038 RepID=A0A9P0F3J3_BEMTA|nr:unnamed protein product [Bemisia tabaci]
MYLIRKKPMALSAITFIFSVILSPVTPDSISLFRDKDFQHHRCDIEVKGCKPVCNGLKRQASSLRGNASCVHFYRRENCESYIGSWNSTMGDLSNFKKTDAQDAIVSVGDCKQPIDPPNSISFYEHAQFGGKKCNIKVNIGCQPMCPELDNQASSADGDAVCAKVYNEPNCKGYLGDLYNLKVSPNEYRNFKKHRDTKVLRDRISSISDCSNRTVSFFEHKHFKGKRCDLEVKGCQRMCPELDKKASSVRGEVGCVRLYKDANCTDYLDSIVVSPSGRRYRDFKYHPYKHYWTKINDQASSIKDCITFDSGNFVFSRPLGLHP